MALFGDALLPKLIQFLKLFPLIKLLSLEHSFTSSIKIQKIASRNIISNKSKKAHSVISKSENE